MMLRVDLRERYTELTGTETIREPDVMSKHELSGIKCHVQNCSLRKTLSAVRMTGSNGDPGHSNSNADYLSSPVTSDVAIAGDECAICARILQGSSPSAYQI